eukprot:4115273-Pyramimonas_sp.AAC.1
MPTQLMFGLLCYTLASCMRLVSWNPMSLQNYDKRFEISRELHPIDALSMASTQSKTMTAYETRATNEFLKIKFGWDNRIRNSTANMSCGTEIWLNRRRFRRNHTVK